MRKISRLGLGFLFALTAFVMNVEASSEILFADSPEYQIEQVVDIDLSTEVSVFETHDKKELMSFIYTYPVTLNYSGSPPIINSININDNYLTNTTVPQDIIWAWHWFLE